jgi:hypothetical protein
MADNKPYEIAKMTDEDRIGPRNIIEQNLWAEIYVGKFGPFVLRVPRGPNQAAEMQAAIDKQVRDVQALNR